MSLLVSDPDSSSLSKSPSPARGHGEEVEGAAPGTLAGTVAPTLAHMSLSLESPKQLLPDEVPKKVTEMSPEKPPEKDTERQSEERSGPLSTVSDAPGHPEKVTIRLRAIGSAAPLSPATFQVGASQSIGTITQYLMRRLRVQSVHVYVLNSFQPTPDETVGDLHSVFQTAGVLNLGYCETVAFG